MRNEMPQANPATDEQNDMQDRNGEDQEAERTKIQSL